MTVQAESPLTPMALQTAVELVLVSDVRLPAGNEALPIAPRRWLWLNADANEIEIVTASGAVVVDVDGKWTAFTCSGAAARRAFAAAFEVGTVLEPRGCASVAIFDCPAVLARKGQESFIVCVQSSYAASFEAAYAVAAGAAPAGSSGASTRP